jgi:hypothetical protein
VVEVELTCGWARKQTVALERAHVLGDARCSGRLEQLSELLERPVSPDHRCALEHGALARTEPVQASSKEGTEGLGRLERAGLGGVCEKLLEKQRVSLRRRDQPHAALVWKCQRVRVQLLRELVDLVGAEWLERDRIRRKLWARLEQLVARHTEHDDRPFAARDDVLDRVEKKRIAPVQVVEKEHERRACGLDLANPPERPGHVFGRTRLTPNRRESGSHNRGVLDTCERFLHDIALAGELAQRRVSGALSVRKAAALANSRAYRANELTRESSLADAAGAVQDY